MPKISRKSAEKKKRLTGAVEMDEEELSFNKHQIVPKFKATKGSKITTSTPTSTKSSNLNSSNVNEIFEGISKEGKVEKRGLAMSEVITTSTPRESIAGNIEDVSKKINEACGVIQGIEKREEESLNEDGNDKSGESEYLIYKDDKRTHKEVNDSPYPGIGAYWLVEMKTHSTQYPHFFKLLRCTLHFSS